MASTDKTRSGAGRHRQEVEDESTMDSGDEGIRNLPRKPTEKPTTNKLPDPTVNVKVYCIIRNDNPKMAADNITVIVYEHQDKYSFYKAGEFWSKGINMAKKAILDTAPYSWAHKSEGIQLVSPHTSYQTFGSLDNLRWENINYQRPSTLQRKLPLPEVSKSGFYKIRISFRANFGNDINTEDDDWEDDYPEYMQNLTPMKIRKVIKQKKASHVARNLIHFNNLDNNINISQKIMQAAELHMEALVHLHCVQTDDNLLEKRQEIQKSIFSAIIYLIQDTPIEKIDKPKRPEIRNNIEATILTPIIERIRNKTLTATMWRAAHHYAVSLKTVPQEINILEEKGRKIHANLKYICDNNFRRFIKGCKPIMPPHLLEEDHDPIKVSETRHEHIIHSTVLSNIGERDLNDTELREILELAGQTTPIEPEIVIDNDEEIEDNNEETTDVTDAEQYHPSKARSTSGVSSAQSPSYSTRSRSPSPADRDWKRTRPKSESERRNVISRQSPDRKTQERINDSERRDRQTTGRRSSDKSPERRHKESSTTKDRHERSEQFSSPNKRHSERRSHSDDKRRRPSYDVDERRNRLEQYNPTERRNYNTDNILGNIKDEDIKNLEPFRPKRYNSKGFKATIGDDGRIYMLPNRSNRP